MPHGDVQPTELQAARHRPEQLRLPARDLLHEHLCCGRHDHRHEIQANTGNAPVQAVNQTITVPARRQVCLPQPVIYCSANSANFINVYFTVNNGPEQFQSVQSPPRDARTNPIALPVPVARASPALPSGPTGAGSAPYEVIPADPARYRERMMQGVGPDVSGAVSCAAQAPAGRTGYAWRLSARRSLSPARLRARQRFSQQQWSRLRAGERRRTTAIAIDLRSMPAGQQGRALLSQLTIQAIEAAAGTRLMLHAAGIADADGRVVALAGPSGMGKTTASSYLARHGFGYVTDETVSIGPGGDVLPFGRPLSLRGPGGEVQRSPDELGLGLPSGDLGIARIVLLDRVPGHRGRPTLTAVPLVDALLELIPHSVGPGEAAQPPAVHEQDHRSLRWRSPSDVWRHGRAGAVVDVGAAGPRDRCP